MARAVLRTCVGCRSIRDTPLLIRITADGAGGVILNSVYAQGRGAYLCPSLECFSRAWERKAVFRALRCELPGLDQAAFRRRFETELRRRGLLAA